MGKQGRRADQLADSSFDLSLSPPPPPPPLPPAPLKLISVETRRLIDCQQRGVGQSLAAGQRNPTLLEIVGNCLKIVDD